MILYKDIYQKAINLFDDPDINKAYVQNKVRFAKLMFPHLDNGVQKFQNPTAIAWQLVKKVSPYGETEISKGQDVIGQRLELSTQPYKDSDYSISINQKYVYDFSVEQEEEGSTTIVFGDTIAINPDDTIVVEWYSCGYFETDLSEVATSAISSQVIMVKVEDILARALVLSWAEKNKNFLLEIRNILTDTDFKLYSPANAIASKVAWVKNMQYEFDTMQNKLGWDLYSVSRKAGGYYGL